MDSYEQYEPVPNSPQFSTKNRNRIIKSFHDPINRFMIQFAPIRHPAPYQGTELSFAA